MKRKKFLFLFLLFLFTNFSFAENLEKEDVILPRKMDIFFYQNNRSFVRDFRILKPEFVNLPDKISLLKADGFTKNILFNTIRVNSQDFKLNYLSKKIMNANLYDLIGQEVYIKTKNFGKDFIKCKILGLENNILSYAVYDKIYFENFSDLILNVDRVNDTDSLYIYGKILKNINAVPLEISYFVNNLYYEINYNLFTIEEEKALLESFIVLYNNSGLDLQDFNLNIVLAGDDDIVLNRINFPVSSQDINKVSTYSLSKKYSLKNRTMKQIKFFEIKDIDVDEFFEINDEVSSDLEFDPGRKVYAEDKIYFQNNTDYDLPFGKINIYRKDKVFGNYVLSKSNFLENTSKNLYAVLKIGSNPNVYLTKKKISYKQFKNSKVEMGIELKINNFYDTPIKIKVVEKFNGFFEIISSSEEYDILNKNSICFNVLVEGNSFKTIKYHFIEN